MHVFDKVSVGVGVVYVVVYVVVVVVVVVWNGMKSTKYLSRSASARETENNDEICCNSLGPFAPNDDHNTRNFFVRNIFIIAVKSPSHTLTHHTHTTVTH